MSTMVSQITDVPLFCSTVGQAQIKKHQRSASLAFVRGIHWWPVNSPHKRPVTRKMFPFDDVIMGAPYWWKYTCYQLMPCFQSCPTGPHWWPLTLVQLMVGVVRQQLLPGPLSTTLLDAKWCHYRPMCHIGFMTHKHYPPIDIHE